MPTLRLTPTFFLSCVVLLVFLARPSHAFGAGNIASTAKIEGSNWRHGDIEDTLLGLLMTSASGGKKFSKMDVKRVYFGNWLRDYSQAVDVGALKMVSAEAIRLLLWILGFMTFGYGTGEFEVTKDRLGCYRPEEHIDNPKDYADNIDAREYDDRLRGPVDERTELAIDERTGLKNYIANEDAGIETSAGLVRKLFGRSIQLARRYNRDGNKDDLYEALRLLGTGCHCLEDYSAHSNFTELVLRELGERDVFPHVGRNAEVEIEGVNERVYPIVTGTFGGVDFLHSVMGEVNDKATQSEIEELEGTITNAQNNTEAQSIVKDLLSKLPDGIFGGKDEAGKVDELQANSTAAQMENLDINPKEPEAFVEQGEQIRRQIYPVLEFHDEIMQNISEAIDKLPILPDLIEEFTSQVNIFVFSLIAPFILPLLSQVKAELATGSSEVIQSSVDKQHIVFEDDDCSDPTHSMLSKDHFSNVLNEPAGKIASQVLKWAVPQIVECWDDEDVDAERNINRIINGVFHHPAQREQGRDGVSDGRQQMFYVVQKWWEDKSDRERDDLREALSREGVENGRNHKEGVHDNGHGCGKPLGMSKVSGKGSGGSGGSQNQTADKIGQGVSEAVGGGALGGILGGLVGKSIGNVLEGEKDKDKVEDAYHGSSSQGRSDYNRPSSSGRRGDYGDDSYGGSSGGRRNDYGNDSYGGSSGGRRNDYGSDSYGGSSYERRTEERYESSSGQYESRSRTEGYGEGGEYSSESRQHGRRSDKGADSDEEKRIKKERKRREKEEKKRRKQERGEEYSEDDSDDSKKHRRNRSGERRRSGSRERHGGGGGGGGGGYGSSSGYGGQSGYGQESGGYGGRSSEYGSGGGGGYGGGDRSEYSNRSEGYGGESGGYGGGRSEYSGGGGGGYGDRSEGSYGAGGMPGGFGGEEEYGRPRHHGDDGGRGYGQGGSGYGQGGGYGGGGY